ncbi:hypothetical protein J3R82DRAFT_446 [Butyriboletus roseoflavus]|nr:hypothetical protein J3R82DRAFT_446 [Butyriboletus roseoflavus]
MPSVPEGSSDEEQERANMTLSVSTMVEAVTKGIEAAICNVMVNGRSFTSPSSKHTPQWRRVENEELQNEKSMEPRKHHDFILGVVHSLLKEKFDITQDIDFINHKRASAADVQAYEQEDSPGPDTNALTFDLTQNHSSLWNGKVLNILLCKLQAQCEEQNWPVKKSDNYILNVLCDHYKRLCTVWRNAQPKLGTSGSLKLPTEVEARLLGQKLQIMKES